MSEERKNSSEHGEARKNYKEKKHFYDAILTVFGRKPVLEALQNSQLHYHRLHLASSNKKGGTIDEILCLAQEKNLEIVYHNRQALSRISKNSKQDQGVALDVHTPGFQDYRDYIFSAMENNRPLNNLNYVALDNITNPQNLGMIIRTVCASPMDGLILPKKGCAKLDSLVIKASAGTLFKAKIFLCDSLRSCLEEFQQLGNKIICLDGSAATSLVDYHQEKQNIFVLGNETIGVNPDIKNLCDLRVSIPMNNEVESLNVAVTAGLIAFRQSFRI